MGTNDHHNKGANQGGNQSPARPATNELTGSIGEFTLVRKIGAGAMGDVYLGKHTTTGQPAAIKLITDRLATDEGFIKRFKREIDVLLGLNHPHIARSLGHQRGALFESDVLTIGMQVARGLAHAYNEAGLVHRDIKPMNILIEQARRGARDGLLMEDGDKAKIIDFGLAKPTDGEDQRLTLTGIVMGTPAYMSPEQIRCEANLDFHTDMYALGATMFHLLTGRIPYPGAAPAIIMTGHLTQPVPDPGELVPSLNPLTRAVVMTAMAKAPRARYADFRAMISACEKALKALPQGPRTIRMLRKPMVRNTGAEEERAAADTDEQTMDFPMLPTDKEVGRLEKQEPTKGTAAHHRRPPSVTTSQIFKASPNIGGVEALEAKNPQSARFTAKPVPTTTDVGSEALRKVLTEKIEKARTTARIRRTEQRMQALDLELRGFSSPMAGIGQLPLGAHLMAYLPGTFLLLVLVTLVVVLVMQQSG
jgi:serine/threonine protein kinase